LKSRASAKRKLSVFDEVFLKDGTKGTVVEFDKSPIGYDICIRSSISGGETVRRWIRRDEIADDEYEGDASDIKLNASNVEKQPHACVKACYDIVSWRSEGAGYLPTSCHTTIVETSLIPDSIAPGENPLTTRPSSCSHER
jgi:hypothetical protein